MVTGEMAALFLVFSLMGVVGCVVLLVIILRMRAEGKAAKRAAQSDSALALQAEPQLAPTPPVPAEPAPSESPAPDAGAPEAAVAEVAGEAATPEPPTAGQAQEAAALPSAPADSAPDQTVVAPSEPAPLPAPSEAKAFGKLFSALNRAPATPGNEILRIVRDAPTGKLSILVAGKPCANLNDIQDPAARQDFLTALRQLQAFTSDALAEAPAPESGTGASADLAKAPPPAQVIYRAAELPPPEMPSMQPFQQLRRRPKSAQFVVKSITEQIEDQLQDKIAGTPLARRGLHVHADSQGNAVFLLDGKIYENVNEVPDPEAQQAIRAAISEWESKK